MTLRDLKGEGGGVDIGISSRLVVVVVVGGDHVGYEGFGSCALLLVTTATYKSDRRINSRACVILISSRRYPLSLRNNSKLFGAVGANYPGTIPGNGGKNLVWGKFGIGT